MGSALMDELRGLSGDELAARLRENKEELMNLRFQREAARLDDPSRIGKVKKEIARIMTLLAERGVKGEAE